MPTLLIIDDERNVRYSLEKGLREEGLTILTAETAREGLQTAQQQTVDAILLDVQLPDLSGLDALARLRERDRKTPVVIMTAHGTAETAIEAMKRGAFDYILKPWNLNELRDVVRRALEAGRLSRVPAVFDQSVHSEDESSDRIVGRSPMMQAVFKEIGRVAALDVNVLILGESGTGKELAARAIYHHSRRNDKPFLALNCAALPESLLESELFGHEKGSFTGADRRRIGKFEQAQGGTLFLDEIGDMSAATQAKVLRVLQDGKFERVGGNETVETDVRILAATNRPLDAAIERKEFREDLYYRLNTFTLRLPPLRDRPSDIPLLADYFLRQHRRRLKIEVDGMTPETVSILTNYGWPGNVRELESAIRYGLVHAAGSTMQPSDLPPELSGAVVRPPSTGVVPRSLSDSAPNNETRTAPPPEPNGDWSNLRHYVRDLLTKGDTNLNVTVHALVDRVLLDEVLRHVDGHQTRAAELLGISRTTLRSRLQHVGLVIEKGVRDADGT
ncbi:MAG: sigma-54-dependent Fis family transcriptional regulator [Planctomycetaceae bacterium]|nr:sigma-54-dependent Fis family transcriptional regulator [Planctomycetaceae bacterium]